MGNQGDNDASGFHWPEQADSVWIFEGNIAHNNRSDGIFTWQNSHLLHIVEDFVVYHNGDNGVEHGAYHNRYIYRNGTSYGNKNAAFRLHSTSLGTSAQTLDNLDLDGADISKYALQIDDHNLPGRQRTVVIDNDFRRYTDAAVKVSKSENDPHLDELLFVSNTFHGRTARTGGWTTSCMKIRSSR